MSTIPGSCSESPKDGARSRRNGQPWQRWRSRSAGEATRRQALRALAGALCALAAARTVRAAEDPRTVGFGISDSVLAGDINGNDARAAMLVWIRRITAEMDLIARFNPHVFDSSEKIEEMLRAGTVDTVTINMLEYRRLMPLLDQTTVFVASEGATLEYVLLARVESGASKKLEQLRGKRLLLLRSPSMCVAPAWLANLVRPLEPGGVERFFGSVAQETKAARAVLPVFFGQADACLVTMRTFTVMSELNPQVARRLSPLAVSPEVVGTLYAFRKGYQSPNRQTLAKALATLNSTPAGRQVLTMYQLDRLVERDVSCLKASLAILDEAERGGRQASPDAKAVTGKGTR